MNSTVKYCSKCRVECDRFSTLDSDNVVSPRLDVVGRAVDKILHDEIKKIAGPT